MRGPEVPYCDYERHELIAEITELQASIDERSDQIADLSRANHYDKWNMRLAIRELGTREEATA